MLDWRQVDWFVFLLIFRRGRHSHLLEQLGGRIQGGLGAGQPGGVAGPGLGADGALVFRIVAGAVGDRANFLVGLRAVQALQRLAVDRVVALVQFVDHFHGLLYGSRGTIPPQRIPPAEDGRLGYADLFGDLPASMALQGEPGDLRQKGFLPLPGLG